MLIDGKLIALQIEQEIKQKLLELPGRKPCLAVIIAGNHSASKIYVARKTKACHEVGIHSFTRELPESVSEHELFAEITKLNANEAVDGILIQLPLPPHINPLKLIHHISPDKDVDGLHPLNVGKLMIGDQDTFIPCTPLGIQVLLERSGIEVASKHVLVVGRSNLVGKPMASLLMQNNLGGNATVTLAHSRTKNLTEICRTADILIVAMGQPKFIKAEMVKEGAIIVDVGINKIPNPTLNSGYQLVGDVDFDQVEKKCAFITPVPGGVGPMTIAMLLSNTLKSFLKSHPVPLA